MLWMFFIAVYVLMMFLFLIGFLFLRCKKAGVSTSGQPFVSVIVAFRNEAENLPVLLQGLCNQDYPDYEIILVDDASTDGGGKIVERLGCEKIRYVRLASHSGKKNAQQAGLALAQGDIIAFTDADCRLPALWLSTSVGCMQAGNAGLCLGDVVLTYDRLFSFAALASLEFAVLLAVTAGAAALGVPFMANGANLLAKRRIVVSADLKKRYASGDDVFLLQSARKSGEKTVFCKCKQALVKTPAPGSLRKFFNQRVRWASKTGASDFTNKAVALIVFLANLSLLVLAVAWPAMFGKMLALKFTADFLMAAAYLPGRLPVRLLILAPLLEIFYIFYAPIVAVWSQTGSYEWKGRKYGKRQADNS